MPASMRLSPAVLWSLAALAAAALFCRELVAGWPHGSGAERHLQEIILIHGTAPRAATALLATAKAWAWLGGYPAITPDHVQTMLVPTWRHRLRLRPEAEIEGVSADAVLSSVVQQTRVPV